jgi:hypothetical protein
MKLIIILFILVCVWIICSLIADNKCINNKEHLTSETSQILSNESIQNIGSVLNSGDGRSVA